MNLDRFIRPEGEVMVCPFCQFPLTVNDNPRFREHQVVGYDCFNCTVPGAHGLNDKPYSRYNIAVMENVQFMDGSLKQIITIETFVMPYKENKWYNIHNNIIKEQTNIVTVEPAREEHMYPGEKPTGLVHIGRPIWFPLIDTFQPSDEEATLRKIKTYVLFS